jgi:hypothetical protein
VVKFVTFIKINFSFIFMILIFIRLNYFLAIFLSINQNLYQENLNILKEFKKKYFSFVNTLHAILSFITKTQFFPFQIILSILKFLPILSSIFYYNNLHQN